MRIFTDCGRSGTSSVITMLPYVSRPSAVDCSCRHVDPMGAWAHAQWQLASAVHCRGADRVSGPHFVLRRFTLGIRLLVVRTKAIRNGTPCAPKIKVIESKLSCNGVLTPNFLVPPLSLLLPSPSQI
jgi:hypothetical protein